MKKILGLCILIILLVAATGCTQPAKQTTPTVTPTPMATTAAPTPEPTMPPATAATTVAPEATTAAPEVTAEANVTATTVVTTVATPKVSMTPSTKITTIYIRNGSFVPKELTVLPGTGITWVNEDNAVHQIKTLPEVGIKFTSSDIVSGASFGYTFGEKEGSFGYIDTYTNITGIVIVKKGDSLVGAPTVATTTSAAATQ